MAVSFKEILKFRSRSISLIALILCGFVLSLKAHAGIGLNVSLGYPSATIKNPEGTIANYNGIAVGSRFIMPFIETGSFEFTLDLVGKYLDLNNTANIPTQRENGNLIGAGVGTSLRLGKIYFGADYLQMRARHFLVGDRDQYLEYEFKPFSYFVGFKSELGKSLSLAVTYSKSSGKIPKASTGLDEDSPYTDSVYWVHFTYETGQSFGKFFVDLFK